MLWPKDTATTVELTPDLLASADDYLCRNKKILLPVDRRFLVALVARIRELESTNAELWSLFEEARDELNGR